MLKAAQRQKINKVATKNKLITNSQSRSVSNYYPFEIPTIQNTNRRDFFDTNLEKLGHLGILKMNREHRFNTLTPHYVKELKRAIDTMDIDDNVKMILMVPQKGEHYSNGTDFRTLLHYKSENDYASITNYLNGLYELQTTVAKLNKPMMAVSPGHAFNSGAALLQATAFPVSTLDSKISFNDTSFGFIPHGGSTYFLSRLPGELGTFLALTGFPLVGKEAAELNIVDDLIHGIKDYHTELSDIVAALDFPIPNGYLMSDRGRSDPWQLYQKRRTEAKREQFMGDHYEKNRQKHQYESGEQFYEPKDKIPSSVAESEFKYKKMMEKYNEVNGPNHELGYFDGQKGVYMNYFSYVMNHVKLHAGQQFSNLPNSMKQHLPMIDRCFYSNTMEEIIQNLKQEQSQFAEICLQKMQNNSMLSMKIALKMLRNAKNQDFKGILESEMNVALNKIQDKEFDLGVKEILLKPHKGEHKNPGFNNNVSDDQVLSFFEENKYKKDIEVGIVSNALLPTRFYFDKYSDQVRLWINEESTTLPHVREFFEMEAQQALRDQGIDIRDRALTQEIARNALYEKERYERRQKEYDERLTQLLTDEKLRQKYQDNITAEIDKLDSNSDEFYKLVNEKIQTIFENAYISKLQHVYDKSKEVQGLEKRRMFIRLKKFLFQSRILNYASEEFERLAQSANSMPFKEIHLLEKWDETYRNMEHPDIQKSFLWHISKAIGKRNITPPELAKAYLTDPSKAKLMQLYTFDKEELLKLQKDVLSDPVKYEKILTEKKDTFNSEDRFSNWGKKREEYDYWYRVLNQGRIPSDSLPFYQQMLLYKDFVASVEEKAIDTLRLTISRLLLDFENQKDLNEVREFTQGKESKTDAFKRLLTLVNDKDQEIKVAEKKIEYDQDNQLIAKERTPSDIKRIVNNLIVADSDLNKLFQTNEKAQSNSLVNNFREKQLDTLYQLIEIALLKKHPNAQVDQKVLQERYAQLVNPKQAPSQNTASLNVIDAYLSNANSESLIRQAIQTVKPYYFQTIQTEMENETRKVFDAYQVESTYQEVLFYYLFHLHNPDFITSKTVQKVFTFNADREREQLFHKVQPESNPRYQLRQFISTMGQNFDTSLPIEQQEQLLRDIAQKGYQAINNAKNIEIEKEKQYNEVAEKRRILMNRAPKTAASREEEGVERPETDEFIYKPSENEEIQEFQRRAEELQQFLTLNKQQMANTLNQRDLLHVYANAIKEFDMDIQGMFRQTAEPDMYNKTNYLESMQNLFGGNRALQWGDLADYSTYLEGFYDAGKQTFFLDKHRMETAEQTQKLMISEMQNLPQSAEQHVRQQSVFDMMMSSRYSLSNIKTRNDDLREELRSTTAMQQRFDQQNKDKESIQKLLSKATKEVQQYVNSILDSSSKYLDLSLLRKQIEHGKTNQIDANKCIDQESLLKDVAQGKLLKDFLQNYESTKLDVMSLAETKALVEGTDKLSDQVKAPIRIVLDHVEQNLRYVPNLRRKEITLGDYMRKHHYLNSSSLNEFSNDILKNIISRTLGERTNLQKVDNVDWEFANYRTNPNVHIEENKRAEKLNTNGQTPFSQTQIDSYVDKVVNKTELEPTKKKYSAYNDEVGDFVETSAQTEAFNEVMKDALDYCKIKSDFLPVKDFFENLVLKMYTSPEFDQTSLEQLIKKYTEMRIKDCMLTPGFKDKLSTDNGHMYMKVLKEQIVDELNLASDPKISQISYQTQINLLFPDEISVEGKYNMLDVNNKDAIGYSNLEERFANVKENREIAHESIFDKLLAEYFLQKRGQFSKSKELMDDINSTFVKLGFRDDHDAKTNDPAQVDMNTVPNGGESAGVMFQLAKQNIGKDSHREIQPSNFNSLMELDIATAQQLQNGRNGLCPELRQQIPEELLIIPEYFSLHDPRKPAKLWVEDKLQNLLEEVFHVRKNLEKSLSRSELIAYDTMLSQFLQKEVLLPRLKKQVETDFNSLYQLSQLNEISKEDEGLNSFKQSLKSKHDQTDTNRKIKNEDALFKFMAYSGQLEKNRREDINKLRKDNEIPYGVHEFTEFYRDQLKTDSQRPAREINPEDYRPKRITEQPVFKTEKERQADFFADFELFKENKKEQHDRTRLFYILEQFFSKTRTQPDPMNKAQQAIEEYFKDTENTFFFDKNKMT